MKINCVGGGPASLYFSILMKRMNPSHDITVYERNPAGSTFGWGVTYWEALIEYLRSADPESGNAISESSVRWQDWVTHVHDRVTVTVENGAEGFGVGRQRLLDIFAERARALGVQLEFDCEIRHEDELTDADLVVAGDGVNSVLRERHADHFGTEMTVGRHPYLWLGTTKVFDAFTFAFRETEHGWIWCYGYGFSPEQSTVVVECTPETWQGLGFDGTNEADCLSMLEKLFADVLDGHPLIGRTRADGSARWEHFPTLTNNRTWHRGNLVLLGDAAHTTHYSIGSGTGLALGDAAVLAEELHRNTELEPALARYEKTRRSEIRSAQRSARHSAQWFEKLPRYIDRPPEQLMELLGQRHSGLLAHLPPGLYYRIWQVVGRFSR
ncbi:FAD-dependent monooxygenase [Nonomuraea glycinis]|uniref:FAD-dependent monooxygenase n=1 Tax=Nonomuraea glycinis TaxID=2047744 RepID=UPI002E13F8FE|nr:FAD-dependent monooxygenase [Nonomuraea glycinis]